MNPYEVYRIFEQEIRRLEAQFGYPVVTRFAEADTELPVSMRDLKYWVGATSYAEMILLEPSRPDWMVDHTCCLLSSHYAGSLSHDGAIQTARHEYAHVLAHSKFGSDWRDTDGHRIPEWYQSCELVNCRSGSSVEIEDYEPGSREYERYLREREGVYGYSISYTTNSGKNPA